MLHSFAAAANENHELPTVLKYLLFFLVMGGFLVFVFAVLDPPKRAKVIGITGLAVALGSVVVIRILT